MHQIQKKLTELGQTYDLRALKLREVMRMIGETHPQKVKHHMQKLGILPPAPGTKDSDAQSQLLSIPLCGLANCGEATIYADSYTDNFLQVSKRLLPFESNNFFAVQAVGDSMNNADINGLSIEDGDYVIVNPDDKNFNDGDYVLSLINDMANIKMFHKDILNHQVILTSESNRNYPPIYIHSDDMSYYKTSGKVITVLKKPKKAEHDITYTRAY